MFLRLMLDREQIASYVNKNHLVVILSVSES